MTVERRKKEETKPRSRGLLFFISVIVLISAGVILYPVYAKSRLLRAEENTMRLELERLRKERAEIQNRVLKLERTPEAVEKVARERYRLCGPGETVMIYDSIRAAEVAQEAEK